MTIRDFIPIGKSAQCKIESIVHVSETESVVFVNMEGKFAADRCIIVSPRWEPKRGMMVCISHTQADDLELSKIEEDQDIAGKVVCYHDLGNGMCLVGVFVRDQDLIVVKCKKIKCTAEVDDKVKVMTQDEEVSVEKLS